LIADPGSADAMNRLKILSSTNNGFEVAEADLQIRGPGELYGRRQAGLPGFKYGDLMRDADLLIAARDDVNEILARDPKLRNPTGQELRTELARRIMANDGPVGEEAG
jgi:ATP-dependent DNA helicase RecG